MAEPGFVREEERKNIRGGTGHFFEGSFPKMVFTGESVHQYLQLKPYIIY